MLPCVSPSICFTLDDVSPNRVFLRFLLSVLFCSTASVHISDRRAVDESFIQQTTASPRTTEAPIDVQARLQYIPQDCCIGDTTVPGARELVVIVAARPERFEDVKWVAEMPYETHFVSDTLKDGSVRYKGQEGGSYLRYIIDNYDALPARMAFMHDHRSGFGQKDQVEILKALDPTSYEYAGLAMQWQSYAYVNEQIDLLKSAGEHEERVKQMELFLHDPDRFLSYTCCGAFLVSAARVKLYSKAAWLKIFEYIQEHPNTGADGWTVEFSWHMLMGEAPKMNITNAAILCPKNPDVCDHFNAHGGPETADDWYERGRYPAHDSPAHDSPAMAQPVTQPMIAQPTNLMPVGISSPLITNNTQMVKVAGGSSPLITNNTQMVKVAGGSDGDSSAASAMIVHSSTNVHLAPQIQAPPPPIMPATETAKLPPSGSPALSIKSSTIQSLGLPCILLWLILPAGLGAGPLL